MKFKFLGKDEISRLPKKPGIYCFKKGKEFLYIGKAANIRERVKNHFQSAFAKASARQATFRDSLFIDKVTRIGFIKTDSEIEALILEANLIKKYQPKYNVIWKDDKSYFFVGITKEDFPRVFWTHQPKLVSSSKYKVLRKKRKNILNTKYKILDTKYVGPFVDGKALKETLKILRKVFPYRTCNVLPKHPCLWYQLSRCPAPCLLKSSLAKEINLKVRMKNECQKNAKNLFKILKGKKREVLSNLKKEMKEASVSQNFEKAAKIRDQIVALERVLAHSKIFYGPEISTIRKPWQNYHDWKEVEKKLKEILKIKEEVSRIEAYDISNIQGQLATGSMVTFANGLPNKNFYRRFKIEIAGKPDDIAMIKEVLSRRFKHPEWSYPDLILIDGGIAQLNAALKIKNQKSKIKNKIKVISIAKKRNELFVEGRKNPILLKNLPREIFNLILQLRDEAHRFALTYHKKLRYKALIEK